MSALLPHLYATLAFLACLIASPLQAQSLLTQRPPDPAAVYVAPPDDVTADATATIQSAIDRVQSTTRRGIVFLGPGRYRINHTIQVWSGIRLIGYGLTRPELYLAPHTFTASNDPHPLLHFAGERPDGPMAEATPGTSSTFYSGLINIDLELGPANPGATGVSFHVAQHGLLSHVRVDATGAFAAIDEAGATLTDLTLVGGQYGIITQQTAASWPFLLMDSSLSGQTVAAIQTTDATATLIRDSFANTPTVLRVDTTRPTQAYLQDDTFAAISATAIVFAKASDHFTLAARVIRCDRVPNLTDSITPRSTRYVVKSLSFGRALTPEDPTATPTSRQSIQPVNSLRPRPATDIAPLPSNATWRNLRDFGAKGDDRTDDTAALRRAIKSGSPIFFPQGRYRITEPLTLGANTVLIGLNPITTQITLADNTPAFAHRSERPTAMLIAPKNSHPILSGIGLSTGGINPAASAILWQAGPHSLIDDVRFLGGHGTTLPDGHYRPNYNADRTADPDPTRPWDTQPPSLLVLGGGGTFRNIWTPNSYAAAGLAARDTSTPANLYMVSAEHHLRNEVTLDHVNHWHFYALQTEAEKTEGAHGVPLAITHSSDLAFANTVFYRVSRTTNPAATAVSLDASPNITFLNVDNRSASAFPFESTITTPTSNVHARFFNLWTNSSAANQR